ncbi:hypothetical protein DFJ63DRAFT_50934 [Scheffersomyces coipomensis]|uniref:uncharacterized protein n=1 Tax=Scheffersomyces coipomensis TaxID=1788519 RepID=UPI00315DF346
MTVIMLNPAVYQLDSDIESNPVEEDHYTSRSNKCSCESCEFINDNYQKAVKLLVWGILFPPLWIYGLWILMYGLVWKSHATIRYDQFIEVFKSRIFNRDEEAQYDLERNIISGDDMYIRYHDTLRDKFSTLIGYTLLAIIISNIIVVLFVFGIRSEHLKYINDVNSGLTKDTSRINYGS